MDGVRAVGGGFWVGVGSRRVRAEELGWILTRVVGKDGWRERKEKKERRGGESEKGKSMEVFSFFSFSSNACCARVT